MITQASLDSRDVAMGTCVDCTKTVGISEFTRHVAQAMNHIARVRCWELLTKSNSVLCEGCYRNWRRKRDAVAREANQRMCAAKQLYREQRKDGAGPDDALAKVPGYIATDSGFVQWRERWEGWFAGRSQSKGRQKSYDGGNA